MRKVYYVNLYADCSSGCGHPWPSRALADAVASSARTCCVRVTLKPREGLGG